MDVISFHPYYQSCKWVQPPHCTDEEAEAQSNEKEPPSDRFQAMDANTDLSGPGACVESLVPPCEGVGTNAALPTEPGTTSHHYGAWRLGLPRGERRFPNSRS